MKTETQSIKTKELNINEKRAIQALYKGTATEYQQRLALKVIVNKFCRADDLLYIPGSFDETVFLQGRGYVGKLIMKTLNQPLESIDFEETAHENS